jgi:hypothetical protein
MRYWTCHWQNRYWENNPEGTPVSASGSNLFSKRGVRPGDFVYIVSIRDGMLLLGGRMMVSEIVSRTEAVKKRRNENLFDTDEWVIAAPASGTRLDFHRALAPDLTRTLRFISSKSPELFFRDAAKTRLDGQTTRGVRELAPDSATLLDKIIRITDREPLSASMKTITEALFK